MGLRDKLNKAASAATNVATSATSVATSAVVAATSTPAPPDQAAAPPSNEPASPVLPQVQSGPVHSDTGALEPIAGITLEYYAELAAKMADCNGDLEVCARIAGENGVDRPTWQAAMDGWNERMNDPATAGEVALAYMPLYQAALATFGGPRATATLDEYAEMLCMINTELKEGEVAEGDVRPVPFEPMYERFGINPPKWSQISTDWVEKIASDPEFGAEFAERCAARIKELDDLWLATHTLPW